MADNLAAACEQAAEALRSLQNITGEDVQRVASSTSTPSATSLCSELSSMFPSYRPGGSNANAHVNQVKRPAAASRQTSSKKRRINNGSGKRGRPGSTSIVHRDLVIIPNPSTKKVPTHAARVALEKNKLVLSGYPFDKAWDAATLKSNIRKQIPGEFMLFEYVKASQKCILNNCAMKYFI